MTIQEYIIRFLIIHQNLNLTEVKEALSKIPGIIPDDIAFNAGEMRINPRSGEKLDGVYSNSRWGFSFTKEWQKGDNEELHDALAKISDKLSPYKEYLRGLKEKGCRMELIISVYVERNVGESFSSDLLEKFGSLGIGLGFDLYPPANL